MIYEIYNNNLPQWCNKIIRPIIIGQGQMNEETEGEMEM